MAKMDNFVKINFKGKDYIGQVKEIDSVWQECRNLGGERFLKLIHYSVTIVEKDTNCCISDIEVKNFFDIKPYEGDNE